MTSRRIAYCLACLLIAACPAAAQAPDPVRTIAPLRGNLYRAQDGPRVTVFRVEPDAIVLVDPMSSEFARYLEQQFAERFPGKPVKYVVYTGADLERVGGAAVFDRTADVIAHERFNERSTAARTRTPALGRNVLYAESTFASKRTLFDGDASIDLIYPGPAAIEAQALVYFRNERVLFAASHPSLTAPFSNRDVRPAAVAQWIATVSEIEFDTLLDGSGATATRADVAAADGYARANIASQLQAGTNVVTMDAIGSVLANRVPTKSIICDAYLACASPPTGLALMAGAGFSMGRFRMVAEINRGARADLGFYEVRTRTARISFLGGITLGGPGRLTVTPLGGLGVATNRYTLLIPVAGATIDHGDESGFVWTFGGDVAAPISRDLAVVVPIRFSQSVDFFGGGRHAGLDIQAGVGLSFTYRRQAR